MNGCSALLGHLITVTDANDFPQKVANWIHLSNLSNRHSAFFCEIDTIFTFLIDRDTE